MKVRINKMTNLSKQYEISTRINLPKDVAKVLQEKKQHFVAQHGSHYRSEPHITLYLESYTRE